MLTFLPKFIRMPLGILLFVINVFVWCIFFFYPIMLCKFIFAKTPLRSFFDNLLVKIANAWIAGNKAIMQIVTNTKFDVRYDQNFKPNLNESYIVASNHQSWVDIVILQIELKHKVPFLRFFIKKQLIWLPLLGFAFWGLDFPRMSRYSLAYLKKHPEMKGKDLEATRKACEHFKTKPVSIINFFEGTRQTEAKYAQQNPPFKHLLRPKAGGAAFALNAMDGSVKKLLDVSLIYPDGQKQFSDLFANRISKVIVDVKVVDIPENLLSGDYQNDQDFKQEFQAWVNELWVKKDELIAKELEA